MKLVSDWKRVLRKAWSVRLNLLAVALTGATAALPAFMGIIPPMWLLALSTVVPISAAVARLVDQPKMRDEP